MKNKNKKSKSGPSNSKLIWNIFAWLSHFKKSIEFTASLSNHAKNLISIETKESGFSVDLNSRSELFAANCILTWWANVGIDNNFNDDGENIFDFDLTKKKNRDKFIA